MNIYDYAVPLASILGKREARTECVSLFGGKLEAPTVCLSVHVTAEPPRVGAATGLVAMCQEHGIGFN